MQEKQGRSLDRHEEVVFWDSETDLGGIIKTFNKRENIPAKPKILGRFWLSEEQGWGDGEKIPIKLKVLQAGERSVWYSSSNILVLGPL